MEDLGYDVNDNDVRILCALQYGEDGSLIAGRIRTAIPGAIFFDGLDHRKPYPGDHGIRFEPTGEEAAHERERACRVRLVSQHAL